VRLDHLLSKERLLPGCGLGVRAFLPPGLGGGGLLVGGDAGLFIVDRLWSWWGILLGPEGTTHFGLLFRVSRSPARKLFRFFAVVALGGWRWGVGWVWVLGWLCWLLFEFCIVDASIFVVKLLRANGGCLGTRSR
jgi:hypothetical protein